MTRTITHRITTVAVTAVTAACIALTALAGASATTANGHMPPSMQLATVYQPQVLFSHTVRAA
jgi:hypothetical protein